MGLKYYPQLDVLRVVAVLLVLLQHYTNYSIVGEMQFGRMGVQLFFVLSGFLITRILLFQRDQASSNFQKWKTFFIRRLLRIFPLYYFVIIFMVLVGSEQAATTFWWNFFYLSNVNMVLQDQWVGHMSHLWSLSVEEHFYLFWPLLILFVSSKRILPAIISVIVISWAYRYYLYLHDISYFNVSIFTVSCLDSLAIGGLLAYANIHKSSFWHQAFYRYKVLFFPFFGAMIFCLLSEEVLDDPYTSWNTAWLSIFSAMAFAYMIVWAMDSKLKIMHWQPLIFLGKISYGIYLWHNFVPGLLTKVPFFGGSNARFILYTAVLIAISYTSYRLIEQPINKLKSRFQYR